MNQFPDSTLIISVKDKIFLNACSELAKMSKCPRNAFAALLVNIDGRVRGHGYNGTVAGQPNLCGGDFCLRDGKETDKVACINCNLLKKLCRGASDKCAATEDGEHAWAKRKEGSIKSGTHPDVGCIHAEANLLINSNREDLVGGTVYVNGEPCLLCAKYLAQSGIARLVYIDGGYSTSEGVDLLVRCGIPTAGLQVISKP